MYGMVHLGMESMVEQRFGPETWARITERAGITDMVMVSNEPYPDEITYALVGAACQELDVEAADLLQAFGRYWLTDFAAEQYRALLDAAGPDLLSFLRHLNNLHVRVGLLVPGYRPPRFDVVEGAEGSMTLRYYSQRDGLAPFVIGLLEGVGDRFDTDVTVRHVAGKADGLDHEVFALTWPPVA